MKPAVPLEQLTEAAWQKQVVDLAKTLGWRRPMHIFDSRRSEPGWPDLSLVDPVRRRFVLLELKTERGRLTAAQEGWVRDLWRAGVEVYVARPRHLYVLAQVLQARGPVNLWTADQLEARGHLLVEVHAVMRESA